jgi:hypothetical protein
MTLDELKSLSGVGQGVYPKSKLQPLSGANMSITGNEKGQLMKKHKIQPGTDAWFQLWFSKPYLTGEPPIK